MSNEPVPEDAPQSFLARHHVLIRENVKGP